MRRLHGAPGWQGHMPCVTPLSQAEGHEITTLDVPESQSVDAARLDAWLAIHPDSTATLFTGNIEQGNGSLNALAQIVAEELAFPFERLSMVMGTTSVHELEDALEADGQVSARLRSPSKHETTFVMEACADELAAAAGKDLPPFHLQHMEDEHAIAVLKAAVQKYGWDERPAHDKKRERDGKLPGHPTSLHFSEIPDDIEMMLVNNNPEHKFTGGGESSTTPPPRSSATPSLTPPARARSRSRPSAARLN